MQRKLKKLMVDIILVEDDSELRTSLADCLKIFGHNVATAENAVELYQLLGLRSFEIAVVDINLPYYDGYSISKYLSENYDMGIIITTARDRVSDRVKGYESGANIYMVKPVDPEELSAAIMSLAMKKNSSTKIKNSPCQLWNYNKETLELEAPNRHLVKLTRREAVFISILMTAMNNLVKREEILNALGSNHTEANSRNLDALLFRLRKKVLHETKHQLPVSAATGHGFVFNNIYTESINPTT